MNETLNKILHGKPDNHMLPFFWQHGEEEAVLRDYMRAIHESGCGAVCVESRPHPDFCGPKWWEDMDVILDEARSRDMKVWILDDSHFPTGYANGAVENALQELCRQSICSQKISLGQEPQEIAINLDALIPPPFIPNLMETHILPRLPKPRKYDDDSILQVIAFSPETHNTLDLMCCVADGVLSWSKPAGDYDIWVCGLSRNCGPHRNYINMLDHESCKLLIDSVYETHWDHYKADFGKTIAGFFSDEPELGNGHLYDTQSRLGSDLDLPFGREMPAALESRLGENWPAQLFLLWENGADSKETARVRYAYMDAVTSLVATNFSWQLGDWCRAHGVSYIGHLIEDSGAHARTGPSLGHFFRGLSGQDMSGIDDIGGQVYPQGENDTSPDFKGEVRAAEFYHFLLGRLASSAAAIEPLKKGRSMCEIFGNYGWSEGVQLEKYLADHFMVRGVNNFVPHAFSPKAFPDPDCPPHFYAHGQNPQFRHFGALMRYMNRICTLTSSGNHSAEVAVLYHAEAEWTGEYMPNEAPARVLEENQISFDVIPTDVFLKPEYFNTILGNPLCVHTQKYRALIVPKAQYIHADFARAVQVLRQKGLPVVFLDALPDGVYAGDTAALTAIEDSEVWTLSALPNMLKGRLNMGEVHADPASTYLRVLHTLGDCEHYYFVNESAQTYQGVITIPSKGPCYAYNAWDNRVESISHKSVEGGTQIHLQLDPRKSLVVVFGEADALCSPTVEVGDEVGFSAWTRSVCESMEYPAFVNEKVVTYPDVLADEQPEFSGFVRYTATFELEHTAGLCLLITDAAEGVEVFVNGVSAGLQIVPPYRYDISALAKPGINTIAIEVATTLERKCYPLLDQMGKRLARKPCAGSGITGKVILYQRR